MRTLNARNAFHRLFSAKSRAAACFTMLAAAMLVTMLVISFDFGIIWDELIQSHYGKLVLRYLITGGRDQTCLKFGETMYLYGGLFDTLTATVYALLFDKIPRVAYYITLKDLHLPHWYETRHFINAAFGFIAMLWTGLLARKLGGRRAGCLALLFIFLSPRFLGNSMNNPKDIPFAAAYIFTVYYLLKFAEQLPRPRWKTVLCVTAGIAATINIKVGGIMLIGYLFLFSGAAWLQNFSSPEKERWNPFRAAPLILGISLAGYLGGMVFWPYGQLAPFKNPLIALTAMSKFGSAEGRMLFEGAQMKFGELPWYYIPKWILISSPLFLHAGMAVFILFFTAIARQYTWRRTLTVLFTAVFPVAYVVYRHSIVYDSWRHLLFAYPSLVVLIALAWDSLFRLAQTRAKQCFVAGLLVLHLAEPAQWMVRNHPHEYVYFSPVTGGIDGAFGLYETDYWGNSIRMGAEWVSAHHQKENGFSRVVVRTDGEVMSAAYYLVKKLGPQFHPYMAGNNNWDFNLAISRGLTSEQLLKGDWPPAQTLHEVKADHTTLCAVVRNPESRLK